MKRKCKSCGFDFNALNKQLYCSDDCRKNFKNSSKRKPSIQFECLICKDEFTQKRKNNITCSTFCSQKLWVKNNPEKNFERYHGESAKKRNSLWLLNNKDKVRKNKQRYKKKKRQNDINFKLNELVGNSIRNGIKDKGFKKWCTIVGYSIEELKTHLETTFQDGLTWEIYLKGGYHIDHIIPKHLYSFESYLDEDFKKCWNFRNLRIITSEENFNKLGKLDYDLVDKHNIRHLLP